MSWKKPESEKTVEMWIARGDGQGVGMDFRPFHTVRSSTRGRAHAFLCVVNGRIVHALSDLEYAKIVLVEFAIGTIDLREQVALLPWKEPHEIARAKGIRPPVFPRTSIPFLLTSDIVATKLGSNGPTDRIFSCKYFADINRRIMDPDLLREVMRTRELLLLEYLYWKRRRTPWRLSTDRTLPWTKFRCLDFFRPTMMSRECDYLNPRIPDFSALFVGAWKAYPTSTLNQLLGYAKARLSISMNEAFTLCGRAVWTRVLPLDLNWEPMHHQCPVRLLTSGQ